MDSAPRYDSYSAHDTIADPAVARREPREGTGDPFSRTTLPVGTMVDHYQVLDVLGSGGMGTVYLAHDETLDRDVAIKVIHADKPSTRAAVEGFLAEARAMARVRHPNLVTIHAFGEHEGRPYFAMEYVPGENLATWRRRHPRLAPAQAVGLLSALAEGVQAIHDARAIHRDLKPSNVLVGSGQRVAVTDFGLARAVDWSTLAQRMPLSGTPAYMAPDVARGEALVPGLLHGLDVYALGVIAFELLTGARPFEASSLDELLHQHAFIAPPRPSSVRTTLSTAFDAPLLDALAKDPAERLPSAHELRRALQYALESTIAPTTTLRVMVVDDEVNTLIAMRDLLMMSMAGTEVVTVSDPASARQIASREPLDLIITDLNMPHGGGAALTMALRSDPETATTPIVVMTAYGGASDWQRLRSLGADRFLVKPVEIDMLVSVIRSLTAKPEDR